MKELKEIRSNIKEDKVDVAFKSFEEVLEMTDFIDDDKMILNDLHLLMNQYSTYMKEYRLGLINEGVNKNKIIYGLLGIISEFERKNDKYKFEKKSFKEKLKTETELKLYTSYSLLLEIEKQEDESRLEYLESRIKKLESIYKILITSGFGLILSNLKLRSKIRSYMNWELEINETLKLSSTEIDKLELSSLSKRIKENNQLSNDLGIDKGQVDNPIDPEIDLSVDEIIEDSDSSDWLDIIN